MPRRGAETVPTSGTLWEWLRGVQPYGPLFGASIDAAREMRAFHWPLEFPDVMQRGGFDVVLGNPPWERIKLQEQEFFGARAPEIAAAPNAAARGRLIAKLKDAAPGTRERALYDAFELAKRAAEAASVFARVPADEGGRFPLTGRGDVNTYALFAELFAGLASERGRAGVIVPTGIATDATTAAFFGAMLNERRLFSLHDFQTGMGYFDRIGHARFKFCLLTVGAKGTGADRPAFSFFSRTPTEYQDRRRHFTLSRDAIANINPNTITTPIFRTTTDADLTAKIHARVPVLIDETRGPAGNSWGATFHTRIWHMAEDSQRFCTGAQLAESRFTRDGSLWITSGVQPAHKVERWVPLYEAKMIHQFDHRWATYDAGATGDDASRNMTDAEKRSPSAEPSPRYWVPEHEVISRLAAKNWTRGWIMGWRDIARATDERTVIANAIPAFGSGDKFLLIFVERESKLCAALLASMNSLVFDFVARQKLGGTSLKLYLMQQLPVLPPSAYTETDLAFIVPRVLELTYTSHAMAPFARDLGYKGPPFPWDDDRRAHLRAELDAFYARAYGLTRDELRYILDPADVKGAGYPSETFRVLKEKETRQLGEYRTQRLVLEAWDRMQAEGTFVKLGLGAASDALAVPATVELPPLADLPNAVWAWPASIQLRDRLRYAAQYALWQMDPASDGARMRFVIAGLAEPALLTPLLAAGDRKQWVRLVGTEAQTGQGTVRLRPALNAAWRSMFETLLASGQLEEGADGAWTRGRDFSPAGLQAASADAQRAAFAIRAVRNMELGSLTDAVAADDNVIWLRFGSDQAG
jgi:hypothetical protein